MTRSNKIQITLFVLFVAFIAMPAIQQNTKLFKVRKLNGDVEKTACPKFTFNSFIKNEYQAKAEKYLSENFGFREYAIRLYNQYAWSCFGMYFNSTIRVGKDNWIYNSDLVRDHYESLMYWTMHGPNKFKRKLDNDALLMLKLQNVLNDYGIKLFVCMTPSKDMIFPEYLPERDESYLEEGVHAYDYFVSKFKDFGIQHIDLGKIYRDLKGNVDYPLYPESGSHWSNLSVSYIGDTLIRYMENLGNMNLLNLQVGPMYSAKPRKPDNDLENVLNLMFRIPRKYYYADVTVIPDSSARRPRMLSMGDSYCQGLNYTLPFDSVFSKYRYWYYNNFISYDPIHEWVKDVDVLDELLDLDYLMVIWCPINIYKLNRLFTGKALINLCVEDAKIQSVFNSVIDSLKNDSVQYGKMCERARNNGTSVNSELRSATYDLLYTTPEDYFEELRDSIPQSRNSRVAQLRGDSLELSAADLQRREIRRRIHTELWMLKKLQSDAESRLISDEQAISEKIDFLIDNKNGRDSQIEAIISAIYADSHWLKEVKHKARKRGISLHEAVVMDAEWMYENRHSK